MLLAGCDDTFEPFAPTDLAFSIHGRLEAAADTQWLRVKPIDGSPEAIESGIIDAVVTVEEIETGTVVEMRDSVFRFQSFISPEIGISVANFWTTMPIQPGRHYRVTATRSDGAFSTATVRIPLMNPRVTVDHFANPLTPSVAQVTGLEHLAMVYADTRVPPCKYHAPIYREVLRAQKSGQTYTVPLYPDAAPQRFRMIPPPPPPDCPVGPRQIILVTSQEEWGWPFENAIELDELVLPDSLNNIEGGVGFLGGTHQLEFPYERCTVPAGATSCRVIYTPASGGLKWNPGP